MEEQNYIYHYTSIQTLAMILNNKTIRFNSLSKVNDLDEERTKENSGIGKHCLVSCWTKLSKESIPLWNMYTPNMMGVRIGFPKDMFDINFDPNEKDRKKTKGLFQIPISKPFPDFLDIVYENTERQLLQGSHCDQSSSLGDVLGRT